VRICENIWVNLCEKEVGTQMGTLLLVSNLI